MNPVLHKLKKPKADESEEWHLSLADMMTLLLCFFVLLASVSQVDKARFDEVAEALSQAMNKKTAPVHPTAAERRAMLEATYADLSQRFSATDKVGLEMRANGVAVSLKGSTFFELGSAELTPQAEQVLAHVAAPLVRAPYELSIEGHTDDIPVHAGVIASNWELSALRAGSVARFLMSQGVDGRKLRIVGLADTQPLAPNKDDQGNPIAANQQRNRRVVVLVYPAAH